MHSKYKHIYNIDSVKTSLMSVKVMIPRCFQKTAAKLIGQLNMLTAFKSSVQFQP